MLSEETSGSVYSDAVLGKAEYQGRRYYVRWHGINGSDAAQESFHLVNLGGDESFWANDDECAWVKRYQKKNTRGKPDDNGRYPMLSSIRNFKW